MRPVAHSHKGAERAKVHYQPFFSLRVWRLCESSFLAIKVILLGVVVSSSGSPVSMLFVAVPRLIGAYDIDFPLSRDYTS